MARVPISQGSSVGLNPVARDRLRPADNNGGVLGGIGAGLQGTGRALSGYAEAQDKLNEQFDEAATKQQVAAYTTFRSQVLTSGENAFLTTQGQGALLARANAEKALDDKIQELSAGLKTKRSQDMFASAITPERTRDGDTIATHATRQVNVWHDQSDDALQVSAGQDFIGATMRGDNDGAIVARETLTNSLRSQYARKGLSGEPEKLALNKTISSLHSSVVDAQVKADPVAASAYLHAHWDEVLPTDRAKLEDSLYGPLVKRAGIAAADFAVTGALAAPSSAPAPVGVGSAARMIAITRSTESGNRDYVNGQLITSPKGAQGAMQTMPGTQRDPGFGITPARDGSVEEKNRVGRDYLAAMMKRYGNDPAKAWAAYNGGPGRVDAAVKKNGESWLQHMPAETRGYVAKNMGMLGGDAGTPAFAPRRDDLGGAYQRIKDMKLPLDVEEAAIAEVDERVARDDRLLVRQQNDAKDIALGEIDRLGDRFKSIDQLSPEVKRNLSPEFRHTLIGEAERNAAADADFNAFNAMSAAPGFQWNQYDPRQQQAVEAAVKAGGGTPQAALDVWQRTGILAKAGAVALRGGLISTDAKLVQASANVAGNMIRQNPNAFAGVQGGEDMERAALAFNHYVFDLGMAPNAAAARIGEENTPEFKAKIKVGQPVLDEYRRRIRKAGADNAAVALDGKFASPGRQLEASRVYAELTVDGLSSGQNLTTAQAVAANQMQKIYGPSRDGKIRKYPPEKAYPLVGGSHAYVYEGAAQAVKSATGIAVTASQVHLAAIAGVTDEDMRNGRPARYGVIYEHEVKGQKVRDTVPGYFVADVAAATTAATEKNARSFARAQADARARERERQRMQGDPATRTGFGATR